jgi:hypothetical protein
MLEMDENGRFRDRVLEGTDGEGIPRPAVALVLPPFGFKPVCKDIFSDVLVDRAAAARSLTVDG